MFTEEIDSISNDLEGIVHQVAKSILGVPVSPAKDELNRKGPFLCTQENIQEEGLVSDLRKVAEKQNQVIPKSFNEVKLKLIKKPLSSEKGLPKIPLPSVRKSTGKSGQDIRANDKGKQKVGIQEQDIDIEGKREVNFSSLVISPFYNRKVDVNIKFCEEEKKVIEYIWSTSNDGRYVEIF